MAVPEYDCYEILGVSPTATEAVIRAAFKALAKSEHPDVGGDKEAFQRIENAHHVLSDPLRRSDYDHSRKTRPSSRADGPTTEGSGARSSGYQHTDGPFWSDWDQAAADLRAQRAARARAEAEQGRQEAEQVAAMREHISRYYVTSAGVSRQPAIGAWAVIWRYGLLGLLFASFADHVLGQIPRPEPFPVSGVSASLTACSMLLAAAGLAALALRFRPRLLGGWPVLAVVYIAAAALTVGAFEAGWSGLSSTAVVVGTVGLVIGSRRTLLGERPASGGEPAPKSPQPSTGNGIDAAPKGSQ